MTLHIFNPEHDIALASNLANFTAPHAGRQLRHDLGFLPVLWAHEGDCVWVDDMEAAKRGLQRLNARLSAKQRLSETMLVTSLRQMGDIDAVDPWGWDAALKAFLKRKGIEERLLPLQGQLEDIRLFSHRRLAAAVLLQLRKLADTIGETTECRSEEQVTDLLQHYGKVVLKAPWSSSGRGLRFLSAEQPLSSQAGWLKNVLTAQGSVMTEPYYKKVKDFGMEFVCTSQGDVRYEGLSLFHTSNGAYTGNILATEDAKLSMISRYIPIDLIKTVQTDICRILTKELGGRYCGPFGVDMMIVADHEQPGAADTHFLLHPCVEINLRRTMGHVALSLTSRVNPAADSEVIKVMRIVFEDHQYKLKIEKL